MKRLVPAAVTLLILIALLAFLSSRPLATPSMAQPEASEPALPLPDAQVLVKMTAFQLSESAAITEGGTALLAQLTPTSDRGGVLSPESLASVHTALASFPNPDDATILARPSMLTLAGQSARMLIENVSVTGERHALEVAVTPTPRADRSIDLPIDLVRKDVSSDVQLFLDDLGLPVGQRRAGADLCIPAGSGAFLIRRLRGGSFLIVLIEPSIIEPAPAAAPAGN